ncbi:MAG: twin-arginine translocase subunit TatC [Flavobacterium sp. BFFFF1]|uniref:twin-arginine translocase subunit TatC n=1 Tax=unclassified Flavobacterium TaxID=196869 RepID=UPI000BD9A353|nr:MULTISPECIES: twin-arginine translocase subunit TatC [unclassified Flavobacterium]OYU80823.1 MAG: twin-arginine translocase subunit TatC [Flavobacterium sp. BFFFF1]
MAKRKDQMSFMDHLEDLRWMLIRSTVAILILASVSYFFIDYIFNTIIFGPSEPDFIVYQWYCHLIQSLGLDSTTACSTSFDFIIQNTEVGGQFSIFLWTCITSGFVLAIPYILWELWKFISPALYEKERKSAASFVVISSFLFFLGALFGYFIIIPLSVNFFGTFIASDKIKNIFIVDSYISMVKTSVIASGIVFEIPIIIYFLSKFGIVTGDFLRKYRKIAIVIILIIAAIVTPPDIPSQVIVSIPILALYEISIFIADRQAKKRLKNEQSS